MPLAVAQGHLVRALTRRPQPTSQGIQWVRGNLADLGELCAGADVIIHIAGTINARDRATFDAGNVTGTASLIAAAQAADIKRFIHVSSLAAREPGLSDYGASKAAGEALVAASGLAAAIIRPPGVYGPGDRETLPIFQMVARGFAVLPGAGRSSWLEVGDLAAVLLRIAENDFNGLAELDDGHGGYTHADFALAIGTALGRRPWLLRVPVAALRVGATIDTALARVRKRTPRLSQDRASYLAHPDWVARPNAAWSGSQHRSAVTPTPGRYGSPVTLPPAVRGSPVELSDGLRHAVDWYRTNDWLR